MRNSPLKRLVMFSVGSALNVALFCLSKYLGFPLWLDYTGSFYITAVCGPVAGALSVILHTLLIVFLIDGVCALWLVIPAVFVSTVICATNQSGFLKTPFSYITSMFGSMLAGALGYFIIFASNYRLPSRYEEYLDAMSGVMQSYGGFLGTVYASLALAFTELIVCLLLFSAAYFLTPRPKSSLSFKK